MDHERLLDRFLRYVRIDTTAREGATEYPSSPGQLELGRLLVGELRAAGLDDAAGDTHGIVTATLRPRAGGATAPPAQQPVVALCAHLDTSPETTGAGVRPQVVRDYDGGDIVLPGDRGRVLRAAEDPELAALAGRTIVTTDGTTLLGADDKAGVATIMEAVAWLVEHPQVRHAPIRVCFTCDEEIGRGVEHLDVARLAATVCYTLDGSGSDTIDVETFSADLAVVTVGGVNIHPSIAKGRMVNALRAAAEFVGRLPRDMAPEATAGRQGFLHPYRVEGGVDRVTLRVLLRDFETEALSAQAALLRKAAAATMAAQPGATVAIDIRPQYRNVRDGLAREPRAVAYAQEAFRRLGREPRLATVRGGTDGSLLTALGLPTPNLSTGEHNPHSPLEWTCVEEMAHAAAMLVELGQVWAKGASPDGTRCGAR